MRKIAIAVVSFSAGWAIAGERLTADELKEFYTDKTQVSMNLKWGPTKTFYGADGTVHSKSESGKERMGHWWIDESSGKRCLRWNSKKKDFCHYLERNGDGSYTLIHGKNGKPLVEISDMVVGNQLD